MSKTTTNPYLKACEALGITPRPELADRSYKRAVAEDGFHRLQICIEAKNLNSDNKDIYYEPIFYEAGSGWAYIDYDYRGTYTGVGPRLRYNSYELMREGVEEFNQYYQDFFIQ